MDCSLPGFSVHGIFQARILEWVAISFSRGSSQPRDWTQVSLNASRRFTLWATREAKSIYFWIYMILISYAHSPKPVFRFQQWVLCGHFLKKKSIHIWNFLLWCYNPLKLYSPPPWNLKVKLGKEDDFERKPKRNHKEMPSIKSKQCWKWSEIKYAKAEEVPLKVAKPLEVILFSSKFRWVFQQRKSFSWELFFISFSKFAEGIFLSRCYTKR